MKGVSIIAENREGRKRKKLQECGKKLWKKERRERII